MAGIFQKFPSQQFWFDASEATSKLAEASIIYQALQYVWAYFTQEVGEDSLHYFKTLAEVDNRVECFWSPSNKSSLNHRIISRKLRQIDHLLAIHKSNPFLHFL